MADRRSRGAYYTPDQLADDVATLALPPGQVAGTPRVLDPACGDGALLAAAARALRAAGDPAPAVAGALHGVDTSEAALAEARERLRGVLGAAAAGVRLLHADALLDDVPGGPFDAVVANPPYLSVKRPWLGAAVREELRRRYRLARGQFDAHACFLERALSLLRPGGRWAFVLPRPVLANRNLADARRLALEEGGLDTLLDAGAPFDAAVEIVVLAGSRGGSAASVACRAAGAGELPALQRSQLLGLPDLVLPAGASGSDVAFFLAASRAGVPASACFRIARGVEAGKRSPAVGLGGPGEPLRAGEEVLAHRLLPPRRRLRATDLPAAHLKSPALFRGPKLLVRRVAPTLVAAVDETDGRVLNTLYLLHPLDGDAERSWAAAAALNSAPLRRWLSVRTAGADRLFPYVRASMLAEVPLPPLDGWLARAARALALGENPSLEREIDERVAAALSP